MMNESNLTNNVNSQGNNAQDSTFNTNYDDTKFINVNTLVKKKKKPTESQEPVKDSAKDNLISLNLKEDSNESISPEKILSTKDVSTNGKDKNSNKHVLNLNKKLGDFNKLSRDDLNVIDEAEDDIKIETISKKI